MVILPQLYCLVTILGLYHCEGGRRFGVGSCVDDWGVFSVVSIGGGDFWDIYLERGLLLSFLVINGFIAYLKKGLG